MQICSVCSEQTPKYRCPSCRIRYCSLGCYKKHKDTCLPAEKPASQSPASKDAAGSAEPWSVEDLLQEDDIIDKVPLQRLQSLSNNSVLCLFVFFVFHSQSSEKLFLLLKGVLRFLFHLCHFLFRSIHRAERSSLQPPPKTAAALR
uniref:Zinc finger HIT-type containing 3 n=1 Tax=Cyprinodon variegatus TaxID=28743 RepID=A0A3Q2D040_CYPVA